MTRVALLWHMHQPFYQDRVTGEHILPWVRMHALKDYWGMAALLREFPDVRVTFNLVPSLLMQIQAFADGRAKDPHLDVGLKPAEHLDAEERAFLVANGFHAPFERMIKPYPRYAELHARRSPGPLAPDEVRDLQVLHKLAWMDPDYLKRDRRLIALVAKQRDYSEEDKEILRAVELELLNAVIPVYREASSTGQVELSTSPFYHPILPLLYNLDVHLERHPDSSLARGVFARPDDAIEQVRRASVFHGELFGDSPAGVWPSEGSLSGEVVEMLSALGVCWTATDEDILARSLGCAITAEALYRCYEVGAPGRTLRCLFRDHRLSDLIGFTYQSWEADAAAADFIEHVRDAGRRFAAELPKGSGEVPTVTVILDGENAWEHYENGGRPFLRALYRQLENATDITTVTMSEAAAAPARRLEAIAAGSWINADFYVWAGHPDDHRAWRQLAAARAALDQHAGEVTPEDRACALEELLIAEGSDWFWWYGDDRSSDHDREFDELFRRHLRNMYRRLGQAPPDELFVTNITTDRRAGGPVRIRHFMTPAIDGVETGILEWSSAVSIPGGGGTMHRATGGFIQDVLVGADRSALFFRMQGGNFAARLASGELEVCLLIDRPARRKFRLGRDVTTGPRLAAAAVVEIAVPLATIGVQAGDCVSLAFLVTDTTGQVLEQFPPAPREIAIPDRHLEARGWVI
jgi:alpha-amylase/alpha-mannosidase (GH57 family)